MNLKDKQKALLGQVKKGSISTSWMLLAILVLMVVFLAIASPRFLMLGNLTNVLRQTSINGVIAVGMTLVIISAGIDLSVGSTVGLTSVVISMIVTETSGLPIWLGVLVAIGVGALVGLFNGIVIHDGKVPAFIATLGTMTAGRGLIMLITKAQMISKLPKPLTNFAQATILGVPWLFVIWFLVLIFTALMLKYTSFGRSIYAVGSNLEAARLSGISIRKTIYGVYVYAGVLCAIAGIMLAARLGNGVPTAGEGFETDAIASAVIGGASLSGAEGTVMGTVLGALIMQILNNGGNLMGINSHLMQVIIGLLIIGAVLSDKLRKKK